MGIRFDRFVLAASAADLTDEPNARGAADLIEFRMDLAENPFDQLDTYSGELPILVTNRAKWEGGEAAESDRLSKLAGAADYRLVEAVDIELRALRRNDEPEAVQHIRDEEVNIIASWHDFERTPSKSRMLSELEAGCEYGDLGKLAVKATSRGDVLDLLTITHRADRDGLTIGTMAMGQIGSHSRVIAPIYGSKIGYAPIDPTKATAPGQIDLKSFAAIAETLDI